MPVARLRLIPAALIALGLLGLPATAGAVANAVTQTSSAATVAPGGTVTLTSAMPVSDAGTVSQEITQTIDPTKLRLTGASDITAPVGWSLQYFNGSSWSGTAPANAGAWAQVTRVKAGGDVVSQGSSPSGKQIATRTAAGVLAATGGSVSTSGGGDGWDVFFDPGYTRIFNRNHHTARLVIDCHWLRTEDGHTGGDRCWPTLPNTDGFGAGVYVNQGGWQNSNRSTGWVDSQDRMWLETVRTTGTDPGLGFFCLDVSGALPQPCATGEWYRLASLPASPTYDSLMDLAVVGGKLFSSMTNGDLVCLDTQAVGGPAACPGQPYVIPSLAGDTSHSRVGSGIRAVSGKVYALTENQLSVPRIWCLDPALITAGSTAASIGCAQWATNPSQVTGTGPLLPVPSASGIFVAVCTFGRGAGSAACRGLQDGAASPTGLPSNLISKLTAYPANSLGHGPTYSGVAASRTHVLWPGNSELYCFDVVTNAMCSGGSWTTGYTAPGNIMVSAIYSVVIDPINPKGFWTNNDVASQLTIRSVSTGTTGCSTVSPVVSFPANVSVPRMGCSSTSAIQEWVSFTIPGTGSPDKLWASATLSVLDPSKTPLTGWDQVAIPANGILSLAGLPVTGGSGGSAWGATDLEFSVTFANPTYTAAPSATIKAIGDSPQLCLRVTAPVNCPAVSAGPIPTPTNTAAMTALGDGSATNDATPPVTTPMAQGSASVTISAPSVVQCSGTLGGRAVDTSSTPRAVAGAVVALYDSSGSPLVYPAGHAQAGQAVTATTDASGYYTFAGVAPANYKVRFVNSASLAAVDTTVTAGGSGTVTATGGAMTSNASTVAIGGTGTVNARFTIASSAAADTSTGVQGAAQTINPLTNDTPLSSGSFTASTARLCVTGTVNGSCAGTSLVMPGEGTYSIANGVVTFTPCSAANTPAGASCTGPFTGEATPIKYVVTDSGSNVVTSTITPTVVAAPTAANDAQSGAYDTNQTITPLLNDAAATGATLTASTVRLCPNPQPSAPYTASNCNQSSVTTSEGTYTANANGTVTFDPLPSFSGVAQTPVRYVVQDSLSQVASALITPTVAPPAAPTASPDTEAVIPGATATFANLITGAGALSTGTGLQTGNTNGPCLVDPSDSVCKATFTISGEGTWTVNRTTGVATFQADANATPGDKTPVTYRVRDVVGQTASSTLTPTVPPPPTASADTTTGVVGQPQTRNLLANDTAGSGTTLTASTVRLCPVNATAPYTATNCNQTSVTTSDGTYTVVNGTITFTPVSGFVGTPTSPLRYVVQDSLGQVASSTYTPTVVAIPAPAAQPDTSFGVQGTVQDIDPLANDAAGSAVFALSAATVLLCGPSQTPPQCSQTSLNVAGEGTYTVDPSTGRVSFQPLPTFTGAATPVTYQVTDAANQTTSSTITPTVVAQGPPAVAPATVTVNAGETGTLRPTVTPGTAPLDQAASCLAAPGATSCAPGTLTLTRPEGTYTLDPATNLVTFAPAAGFTGTPSTPPKLCVTDQAGQSACGLLTPTVLEPVVRPTNTTPVPIASPDYATTQKGTPVVLDVLLNDAASKGETITPASVRLKDPKTGTWVKTVTIPGEGTYTVDPATGKVTFTPPKAFTGTATVLDYRFADSAGRIAKATLEVKVVTTPPPYANPDYAFGPKGRPLILNTFANDSSSTSSFDPASVKLRDPKTGKWTSEVTLPGQGTYRVDPTTGSVIFTPLPGFTGTATPITYTAATASGRRITSTLHPRILGPEPTLDITLTPSRTIARTGDRITATLRACNTGKGTAVDSAVMLTLPPGLAIVERRGARLERGAPTWSVGTLAPGQCVTRTILLTATDPGLVRLRSTVTAANAASAHDPGRIRITDPDAPRTPSIVTG